MVKETSKGFSGTAGVDGDRRPRATLSSTWRNLKRLQRCWQAIPDFQIVIEVFNDKKGDERFAAADYSGSTGSL